MERHMLTELELMDGEALNRENPHTFHIPSEVARKNLQKGDIVKVGWKRPVEIAGELNAERMWVEVVRKEGEKYVGKLRNQPFVFNKELKFGDEVMFEPKHVLSQ